MAANGAAAAPEPSNRRKLDFQRATIEEAAAHLVHELTLFDRACKSGETARHIALRITSAQVVLAVLGEKLALAQVSVWNEL